MDESLKEWFSENCSPKAEEPVTAESPELTAELPHTPELVKKMVVGRRRRTVRRQRKTRPGVYKRRMTQGGRRRVHRRRQGPRKPIGYRRCRKPVVHKRRRPLMAEYI